MWRFSLWGLKRNPAQLQLAGMRLLSRGKALFFIFQVGAAHPFRQGGEMAKVEMGGSATRSHHRFFIWLSNWGVPIDDICLSFVVVYDHHFVSWLYITITICFMFFQCFIHFCSWSTKADRVFLLDGCALLFFRVIHDFFLNLGYKDSCSRNFYS